MSNSYPCAKITLYKTKLKRDLNALIDSLESYLTEYGSPSSTYNIMYTRHDSYITRRLDLPENNQLELDYNYCKIVNYKTSLIAETPAMYYFIINKRQISQNCIELELKLDVVNSLGQGTNGTNGLANPRKFTKYTKITRQHKDRFIKPTSFNPLATTNKLFRKIDKISEEIVPNKVLESDTVLINDLNYDFYLIYKGSAAIDTYLVANEPIDVGKEPEGSSVTLDYHDLTNNTNYYFLDIDNPGGKFTLNGISYYLGQTYTAVNDITLATPPLVESYTTNTLRGVMLRRESSKLLVGFLWSTPTACVNYDLDRVVRSLTTCALPNYTQYSISTNPSNYLKQYTDITFEQANFMRVSTTQYGDQSPEGIKALVSATYGLFVGSGLVQTLGTIDDVDRTDSELVKIIKYPYCPIPYTYDDVNDIFDFGADWEYSGGLLHYTGTSVPTLGINGVVEKSLDAELKYTFYGVITANDLPNKNLESKLKHSDFRTNKINYDSFNAPIYLENITPDTTDINEQALLTIDFKPTSTINSKFAFKLDYSAIGVYNSTIDYDKFLLATRNNEEAILNSEYLNYIKVGYNYDKKAQALQIENAQKNAAATSVASIASIVASVLGVALGGPTVKAASIIGLGTSVASGAISTLKAWDNVKDVQASQENNMAAKLAQLQAQAMTTSGTDDVDLLSFYNGNRLHYMVYDLTTEMRDSIFTALFLTGYKSVDTGTPDVDSRYWFNFLQCDPSIDYEGVSYIKQEWIDELKELYRNGVTIFHKHNTTWNLERNKENYETWIVEGVS